jgi:pre-mRNA-splicing factor CWC26
MSSGHKSGLQKSEDFARAESKLRKRQREELAQFNLTNGNNGSGETIYRDASGKKRTISSKHDEEQLRREEEEKEAQQQHVNKGRYQRMQEENRLRELGEAANMTLARGIEDEQLEERKRSIIREGDPMAMHEWKKQQERQSKQSAMNGGGEAAMLHRPVYKGPQPKPNRYGIRPGYRWDGIDRGNGFEDRVLEMLHSKGRKKEEAYKWSAADM